MLHTKDKVINTFKSFYNTSLVKKLTISSLAIGILAIGSAAAESSISTVYHVYLNNEQIGTVDNKDVVNTFVDNKIKELKKTEQYKELELLPDNLSFVAETVFRPKGRNKEAIESLEDELNIVANAAVLMVDDKPVAFLKDEQDANNALKQLKLQYVKEEELIELEARIKSNIVLPALKENESRLLDVSFTEKVSVSKQKVLPEQILSVDNAVMLLQKGTLEEKKYVVQTGDVLGTIANSHGLTTKEILELNPDLTEESVLQIGQEVNITYLQPYIHVAVKVEENRLEEIGHEIEVKEDANMYKGDKKVTQEGQNGQKSVNYELKKVNGQVVEQTVTNETILKEPVKEIVVKGTKVISSRGSGQLSWPASGGYISSGLGYRWGKMHKGIDIAQPSNYTIKAADNGTVVSAGWDGGYGNKIVINHNNGLKTVYAHLASISVGVGQTVSKGQAIGVMGSTGQSTGIHLHFEVYKNGSLENPSNYLQ